MSTIPYSGRVFRRSRSDRIVGGVCAGLARYFDIDPLLIRLVFVVMTLAQGAGIVLYILLWILVPEEGVERAPAGGELVRSGMTSVREDVTKAAEDVRTATPRGHRLSAWLGVLLIGIGAYLLALYSGLFWWWDWRIAGPVLLVLAGALLLLRRLR